jgi:ABC-type bacteriocin/lantibiotic exporter with double-glycine peptidase domain
MIYGLTRLGKTLDNFYDLLTSVDKIGHLLDLPQESTEGIAAMTESSAYSIHVKNLSLPYSPQLDMLTQFDLHIPAGERLVISKGAERGSLLEVLFGLRTPAGGVIQLNDQDLRDLNLQQLRDTVALVKDAEIMAASIADNVSMGRELDIRELRLALDQAGLLTFISTLPDGLQTELGLHGAPLNQEQCLRLTLARAIALKPRLLMLDHVLDRIDQANQTLLLDSLTHPDTDWTLIILSQQTPVINACSRHCQIEQGQLVTINPLPEVL